MTDVSYDDFDEPGAAWELPERQSVRGLEGGVISCSAPGRAGIIGNPTDMYGGSVVSCSLMNRAYCELSPSDSLVVNIGLTHRIIRDKSDLELKGDNFDLARAALNAFELDPREHKFAMNLKTDVPEQAGLAGSSAMLASIVGALLTYIGLDDVNRYQIAELTKRIEYKGMCLTCGYHDHYMAVFGGLNFMDFRGKEMMEQTPSEPLATVEPLCELVPVLPMVLAHTGVKRNSGAVHKSLRERWLEYDKDVIIGYEEIAELARLGKKALVMRDWELLGQLMNENHHIQRRLGGSGESNEALIKAALDNGALGAKLAGAGQGGTIIALANIERMSEVLLAAGATKIFRLGPCEGLIAERRV